MCGILGIVSKDPSKYSPALLSRTINSLYKLSETRGKEASGISYIENGSIKVIKQNTSASQLLKSKAFKENIDYYIAELGNKKETLSLIGHSRLVTNGDSSLHYNNQPVIASGLVAVHNGIIVNDDALWRKFPHFERHYQVDTEIILNLIRHFLKEGSSISDATRKAFSEIKGATSLAIQFDDLNCVLLATNNGSLYLASSDNMIFFASEEFIIKSTLEMFPELASKGTFNTLQIEPNNGVVIELDSLKQNHFKLNDYEEPSPWIATNFRKRQIIDLLNGNKSAPKMLQPSAVVPAIFEKIFNERAEQIAGLKRCNRCVLPSTMPFITFDSKGTCSYCRNYHPIKLRGYAALEKEVESYKRSSSKYNCIVSLSGGRDSSYGLHYIKNVLGMRPITYTYDWGMVTDLARRNISRICGKLGIEHILISADIRRKRENIRKNVSAWLKKPDLGMIPLFMAGDKQFFYHGDKLKKQLGIDLTVISENLLEKTSFKTGFCGIDPNLKSEHTYSLPLANKLKLMSYYGRNYLLNPSYLNSSLLDTFLAYCSYYVMNHNFLFLYKYIPWEEKEVESVLLNEYEWELAPDTHSSWRIGDGTAAFYNYIYYMIAGFTENDTFRSNQIRENQISRDKALSLVNRDNRPRWESIQWYCAAINIDFEAAVKSINSVSPLYSLS